MRAAIALVCFVLGCAIGFVATEYRSRPVEDKPVEVKTYVYPDVKDTILPLDYVSYGFSITDSIRGDFAGIHQQIQAINAGIEKLKQDRDYWMNKALDPRCDVWRVEQ